MIEWHPRFEGEPQMCADVAEIVSLTAGANSSPKRGRSRDGTDDTGRFPWSAFTAAHAHYDSGHADTIDEAKRAAVAAAKKILTAALAECDDGATP